MLYNTVDLMKNIEVLDIFGENRRMESSRRHQQTTRAPFWILCVIFIAGQVGHVFATTTSLSLQQSGLVQVGELVTFTCSASGTAGNDPTLEWTIKTINGDPISTLNGNQNSGTSLVDGYATSSVTFTVADSHIGQRIWCASVEGGFTTMQIYSSLIAASNSVGLGQDCSGNAVCTTSFSSCQLTGTNPIQNRCRCTANYYDSNGNSAGGSCDAKSGLDGSCSTTVTDSCLTSYAECSSGTCVCLSGFIQSDTICIPDSTAGLGESCVNPTRSCSVTSSECSSTGLCVCKAGYYMSASNVCSPQGTVGQACIYTVAGSCSTTDSYCSSNTGTCQCSAGRTYTASKNMCELPVLGQPCSVTTGCRATSTGGNTADPQCSPSNNICSCEDGYYALNGVCYSKSALGGTCSNTVFDSCSDVNSQCTGSPLTCQCNFGYMNIANVCIQYSSTDPCPANTKETKTSYGITSPFGATTPDTTVAWTCYTVDIYNSVTMNCEDIRGAAAPALQFGGWVKLPYNEPVIQQIGRFINGDLTNPSLTVSNAQLSDDASYYCKLCYGAGQTRCTNSATVKLNVIGTGANVGEECSGTDSCATTNSYCHAGLGYCFCDGDRTYNEATNSCDLTITSVTATHSPAVIVKEQAVTFNCTTTPAGIADSYRWLWNGVLFRSTATFELPNIQSDNDGSYVCEASNSYGTVASGALTVDVRYLPEYSLANGGDTVNYFGNLDTDPVVIQCTMSANPAIDTYYFYDSSNTVLQSTASNTYTVYTTMGYGTYRCEAVNAVGRSTQPLYFGVQLETSTPNTGAATEDTAIATGTIAAIVLGLIFLILLIVVIVVCCCSYGWCRKKEKSKVEPAVEKPVLPYIPRSVTSAVSRKDVGITVNSLPPSDYEEPTRYITPTPRFYLKPATNGGPIISMYDNDYSQPRPHQLPSLDTSYLYTDEEPKKRHRKHKRRRRHHDSEVEPSPRQSYYESEHANTSYAEIAPPNDDLVVIPGKDNYSE